MNSEDASQLQFLKTLDSVAAKTQQIKTSFQELYVNSGLENFYKKLLDFGNNVIQTFTRMPKTFNLPILAIAKFGSTFLSLATVFRTLFRVLSSIVATETKRITILVKMAHNERRTAEEESFARSNASLSKYMDEQVRITEDGERKKTDAVINGNAQRENANSNTGAAKKALNGHRALTVVGTVASMAGAGLSLAAANIDETKSLEDRSRKAKWTIGGAIGQGIGGAISGAQMGAALGPWGAVAGGVLGAAMSALPGIIEGVGLASESTSEKITRLNKAVEDTNNEALKSKNELKTLEDYKEKYNELYKVRNRDNESRQAWLDLNNEIVANYPGLFSYMDAEGNKIADMTTGYEAYLKAKREAYESDLLDTTAASIEVAYDAETLANDFGVNASGDKLNTNSYLESSEDVQNFWGSILSNIATGNVDLDQIKKDVGLKISGSGESYVNTVITNAGDLDSLYQHGAEIVARLIDLVLNEGVTTLDEAEDILTDQFKESITISSDFFTELNKATGASEFGSQEQERRIEQAVSNSTDYLIAYTKGLEDTSSFIRDKTVEVGVESLTQFLEDNPDMTPGQAYKTWYRNTWAPYIKETVETVQDSLYGEVSQSVQTTINDIYNNLGKYTKSSLKGELKALGLKENDEITQLIVGAWEERYDSSIDAFKETMSESYAGAGLSNSSLGDYWAKIFSPDQLNTIQTLYTDVLNNENSSRTQKINQTHAFNRMFFTVNRLSEEQQELFFANLANADLTTIQGVYDFMNSLVDAGIDLDESGIRQSITDFKDSLSVNIGTEFDMAADNLVNNISDFEKAVSNALKGMDLSTATEMARKMGKSISDFEFRDGKFFFNDIEALEDAYLKENEAVIEELRGQRDAFDAVAGKFRKRKKTFRHDGAEGAAITYQPDNFLNVLTEVQDTRWVNDDLDTRLAYLQNQWLLDENQAQLIIDYYDKYYDAWKDAGEDAGSFYEYVMAQLDSSIDDYESDKEYIKQYANRALIQAGQFQDFYDRVVFFQFNSFEEVANAVLSGDFSGLESGTREAIEPYISELYTALSSFAGNAFKNVINSISNGKTYVGTASSDEEKEFLESLGAEFIGDTLTYYLDGQANTLEYYQQVLKNALDEGKITIQEYNTYYSQFAKAFSNEEFASAFDTAVKDYENISADTAEKLATGVGLTVDQLGLVYDEVTNTYSATAIQMEGLLQRSGLYATEWGQEAIVALRENERKKLPSNQFKEIISNREKLTDENIASLMKLLKLDYNQVMELIEYDANGNRTISLSKLTETMRSNGIMFTDAVENSLVEEYDKILSQATGLVSNQNKGYTTVGDMSKFQEWIGADDMSGLFDWSDTLHAYVLTSNGVKASAEKALEELNAFDKGSDEYEAYMQFLGDVGRQFLGDAFSEIENLTSDNAKTREQAEEKFKRSVENYNTWLEEMGRTSEALDAGSFISEIRRGGSVGVAAAQLIAERSGNILSDDEIANIYRNSISPLLNAVEKVATGVGGIVDATTAEIIEGAGGQVTQLGNTGQYVINTAADLVDAYESIYNSLYESGKATVAELNSIKAKQLISKDKVTELGYLSSAAAMSYEQFGEMLASMGVILTDELFDTLGNDIEQLGNGQIRINNFKGFADALGIDTSSEAYISAFKTYNDSMIELNDKTDKAIKDELASVSSASLGSKVNVTTLFSELGEDAVASLNEELIKWGATIKDGILDISENANLYEVIQAIYNEANSKGLLLERDVKELADALDTVLKTFADTLQKGIKGTLTNTEAYDLQTTAKNMFDIDLDFTETKDGLKVSTDQAIQLYYAVKKVDSLQAGVVFDGLKESLTETGEVCESITATLAEIHKLEEQLSKGPENTQVQERLNLYREIAAQQMNDPSQYSFMDNKLPDILQGPENYWNAWDKAYTAMNNAAQNGYMSTQDFYNLVNEMSNVARLSGDSIMFMGQELDGSLEAASALIEKGFGALKVVQGQGAQIDLSESGLNITGIDEMVNMTDEQLKLVAQANIDMLDSMIQMLEIVVAMEDLGDIDGKGNEPKDNKLSLEELFNEVDGVFFADQETRDWAAKIIKQTDKNKDLEKALKTFYIGEESLFSILEKLSDPNFTFEEEDANRYQKILQALYDAYLNGDFDLDNLQQSIIDVFSKEFGEVDTIQVGDKKYAIGYGTILEPEPDGTYKIGEKVFTDVKEALQYQALLDAGVLAEEIGDYNTETNITTGTRTFKDGSSIVVEVGEKGIKYSVPMLRGKTFNSLDEAMTAWYNYEKHEGLTTDDQETWGADKGYTFLVSGDTSALEKDPIYQIMIDGETDVTINLDAKLSPLLQKILKFFGISGGEGNNPTPTPTPTPTPDNPKSPQAVYDDGSKYNKNKNQKPSKEELLAVLKTKKGDSSDDTSGINAATAALQALKTAASELAEAIRQIPDNGKYVSDLASAMSRIPSSVADRISTLAAAINRIPERRTIEALLRFRVESNGAQVQGSLDELRIYKSGNVALKSGTLMGELGPELVVSKGRYFVVGQNGAEMVDLDPDAVVFNHLQTERLLKNGKAGRGKAVTNERKAVSMATGNVSGPAMASASAALASLKQLRAMWQALLGASLSDLGALGGSGGGGGGGGGGGNDPTKSNAGFIADLERWYNLLRQISKLEKEITYQETLRNALWKGASEAGHSYYQSLMDSLDALTQTAAKQSELSNLQKSYYDRRREDLASSAFAKIFTFDNEGKMQYNDNANLPGGQRGGLFALSELNRRKADGSSYYTAKQQFEMLKKWGFGNEMRYDSQGKEIVMDKDSKNADDYYTKAVQAFWDKADGWKDELDGLFDSYTEALKAAQEAVQKSLEIYKQLDEAQTKLEQTVLDTIVQIREREIQDLQDVADNMQETADKYIEGLNDALQREQQMYQNNKAQQDLDKNRRRLAILQRTGGSASEIASLQNTIDDQAQQMYFDKQQQQIDAIQEASDQQIEKLNKQIDLMTEQLDYEKANGMLWGEVYKVMSGTESEITNFITGNNDAYKGLSQVQWKTQVDEGLKKDVQTVKDYLTRGQAVVGEKMWEGIAGSKEFENLGDTEKAAAKEAFLKEYGESGDYEKARNAALKAAGLKAEPTAEQQKSGKDAAEKFFGDEANLSDWKKKYKGIYDDVLEERGKQVYAQKYAEALEAGETPEKAAELARQAVAEEFQKQYNQNTLNNYGPNVIRNKVRDALGKNNFDKDFWADVKSEVEEKYREEYLESGDVKKATDAAVKEYKDIKKANNAEAYWKKWTNGLLNKKKPNDKQKQWKGLLKDPDPNHVAIVEEAHTAFLEAFDGKNKKLRRTNARNAAKSVFAANGYSEGGTVDYTGLAQVHGTPSKPEYFLNAADTAMWKRDILGTQPGSLTSSLLDLNELVQNMVTGNKIVRDEAGSGFSIGNIDFTMNATIASDYDAKKAGRLAFEEMLKIAQKTGTTSLSRR